jgi:outer membrane protein assembly factor BamE (lipoprotein component of BamABCDE complex)
VPRIKGKEASRMTIKSGIVAALTAMVLLSGASAFARGFLQSPEILDKIKAGVTTAQEVEQILGPPANRSQFPRVGLTSMDYVMRVGTDTYDVGVMLNKDGVVQDVQKIMRYRGGA